MTLSIHIRSDQVQGTMITLIWVPIYRLFIFITGSEHNVSGLVIIIGFVTGSMLSPRDSCVDMATEGDVDPC